ncbi:hypothetical protein [Streptomyces griseus]|nr:hypothetical protein [Streptomyces fimicarius]
MLLVVSWRGWDDADPDEPEEPDEVAGRRLRREKMLMPTTFLP